MAALDLLGHRWTLRILWELRDGPFGFRELQERCDAMSPSVLSDRLRELRDVGLVARDDADRYALTDLGRSLRKAITPLGTWAETWANQIDSSAASGS